MVERVEIQRKEGANCLSHLAQAMQDAAVAHSFLLQVDHDRLLEEHGCLWMLVRYRIAMERLPEGALTVETFLRSPNAAFSLRDFTFFDEKGKCGEGVQTWVIADEAERKLRPISQIPSLLRGPFPEPQRNSRPLRFSLPKTMEHRALWTVSPGDIDANGHLNNVVYVRQAEALVCSGYRVLDVSFERECFAGETLRLSSALTDKGEYVGIYKEDGTLSFSACFRKEIEA